MLTNLFVKMMLLHSNTEELFVTVSSVVSFQQIINWQTAGIDVVL